MALNLCSRVWWIGDKAYIDDIEDKVYIDNIFVNYN